MITRNTFILVLTIAIAEETVITQDVIAIMNILAVHVNVSFYIILIQLHFTKILNYFTQQI